MTRAKGTSKSPTKTQKPKLQEILRPRRACRKTVEENIQTEEAAAAVDRSGPSDAEGRWTKEDKKVLLEGLKTYGHENLPAIAELLPHIPAENVKTKILKYSVLSEYLYEDALINDWTECGLYKEGDSPVAEALLFVKLFERHPSPADVKGYNFREIYNFLRSSCFQGPARPELSQKSQGLLYAALSRVDRRVWPACQKDLWEYLGRVYNRRHISKVYPGKRASFL